MNQLNKKEVFKVEFRITTNDQYYVPVTKKAFKLFRWESIWNDIDCYIVHERSLRQRFSNLQLKRS